MTITTYSLKSRIALRCCSSGLGLAIATTSLVAQAAPCDPWQSNIEYAEDSLVQYGGSFYVALRFVFQNTPPGNTWFWAQTDECNDSDNDAIPDGADSCPNTASGADVDDNGCSDLQVDEDADGVCNAGATSDGPSACVGSDACPGTGPGKAVDVNGCADDQGGGVCEKAWEVSENGDAVLTPEVVGVVSVGHDTPRPGALLDVAGPIRGETLTLDGDAEGNGINTYIDLLTSAHPPLVKSYRIAHTVFPPNIGNEAFSIGQGGADAPDFLIREGRIGFAGTTHPTALLSLNELPGDDDQRLLEFGQDGDEHFSLRGDFSGTSEALRLMSRHIEAPIIALHDDGDVDVARDLAVGRNASVSGDLAVGTDSTTGDLEVFDSFNTEFRVVAEQTDNGLPNNPTAKAAITMEAGATTTEIASQGGDFKLDHDTGARLLMRDDGSVCLGSGCQ